MTARKRRRVASELSACLGCFIAQLGDAAWITLEVALEFSLNLETDALVEVICRRVAHHNVQHHGLLQSPEHFPDERSCHAFATKCKMDEKPSDEATPTSAEASNTMSDFRDKNLRAAE